MYMIRKYEMCIIKVSTLGIAAEYAEHLPDSLIFGEYKGDVIAKLIKMQEDAISENIARGMSALVAAEHIPHYFLIIDDLGFDRALHNDRNMKKLVLNGRHYKTTIIIAAQYVMQISKENRAQMDFVFITFEKTWRLRRQIYEQFDVGFPDFETFEAVMKHLTEDYRVMVLDRRSNRSDQLVDSVFFTRAVIGRKFRMCPGAVWRHHRNNYNIRYTNVSGVSTTMINDKRKRKRQLVIRRVKQPPVKKRRYDSRYIVV